MTYKGKFQITAAIGAGGKVECCECGEVHWHIGGSGHELKMWADRHECAGGAA